MVNSCCVTGCNNESYPGSRFSFHGYINIMESKEERLKKARLERMSREKARIDKLRELNLKKYFQDDTPSKTPSNVNVNGTSNQPLTGPSNKVTVDKAEPLMKSGGTLKTCDVPVKSTTVKKNFVKINKIRASSLHKLKVNAIKKCPNIARNILDPIKISDQPKLSRRSMPSTSSQISEKPKASRMCMPMLEKVPQQPSFAAMLRWKWASPDERIKFKYLQKWASSGEKPDTNKDEEDQPAVIKHRPRFIIPKRKTAKPKKKM